MKLMTMAYKNSPFFKDALNIFFFFLITMLVKAYNMPKWIRRMLKLTKSEGGCVSFFSLEKGVLDERALRLFLQLFFRNREEVWALYIACRHYIRAQRRTDSTVPGHPGDPADIRRLGCIRPREG